MATVGLSLALALELLVSVALLADIYVRQEQFTWQPFGEDRPTYRNIEARAQWSGVR